MSGLRIGSLFSGAGGLDMAVQAVFGGEVVWHCELDQAASKVLSERWPGVLNHCDITTMGDVWPYVEPVDVLCGGWPCQPFSLAGKRKGIEDERALWPYVAGAVRALRPRVVVLENVSAVLRSPEFSRVANSLAALGYDLRWTSLRASDVGAPHRRERLFVIATDSKRVGWQRGPSAPTGSNRRRHKAGEPYGHRTAVADSPRNGWDEGRPESARFVGGSDAPVSGDGSVELLPTPTGRDHKGRNQRDDDTCLPGALLPTPSASDGIGGGPNNPENRLAQGHHVQLLDLGMSATVWGKYEAAIRRWEQLTRTAPAPTEPNKNGNPRLSAAFSEWLMGWPTGWVTEVPGISRNDQLRIVGNGVVPQQAIAALRWLLNVSEVAA